MPLRKYQIAKKAIDKTKLDDDAQVKVSTVTIIVGGSGANITGNAGTTYAELPGTSFPFYPDYYKNILEARIWVDWNANTAAAGVRLYNTTDGVEVAKEEPGAVGIHFWEADITTHIKALTAFKRFMLHTKGDGTTAPVIRGASIHIVVSTVP